MKNTLIKSTCALGSFSFGAIPKNHASAPRNHASGEGNHASVEVYRTSVEVYQAPVEVYRTPVEVYRTSVEVYRTPVEVYRTSVEVYQTSVEVYRTPVEVYQTSVEVYGTSILRIISNINPYNLIIMVNYISRVLTTFICKRSRMLALAITLALGLVIPAFAVDYTFQVTGTVDGGNRAFNEQRTIGTYRVTLRKVTGPVENMAANDHLFLTVPQEFNLSGNAYISSGLGTGAVTTLGNAVVGTERQIKLSLPIAAYNSAPSKGVGVDVVYGIPLVYTPNGQTLALNPEQEFEAIVMTTDLSSPEAIGGYTLEIAVLTALENTARACLNMAKTLQITSTGFSGAWYDDEAKTNPALSTVSAYDYTPTSQSTGRKTFYVSAVFGSNDYGMAPVVVTMNPEATITVTAPAVQCSSTSSVNLASTVSNTPAGSTVAFYSNAAGTTALGSTTVSPATTTTYYARVTTTEGCQSALTPILVKVNPTPSLTAPANQTVSLGTTTAISLNGTNATHYTWTGAAAIGLADNSAPGQTQIPSFTAVNSGTSPITRTVTVTPHNTANSVTCDGSPQTFNITVTSSINGGTFQNQEGCAATTQAAISATGATNVAYYKWSGGSSVGLADNSGTGQTQIPSFTLANVTSTTTATVTVIPYNSGDVAGAATSFSITVHPRPHVTLSHNKPPTDGACLNTDVTFTTEPGKTNYVWNLGGATTTISGGTTSSNTAVLRWNTPGTKTVTVNYTDANGCSATSEVSRQVVINPAPVAGTFSNISLCTGATQAAITPSGGTSVTYYTWSGGASSGLADYSGTGRTQIPAFTATSGITTVRTATITVVPHYVNGTVTCDGAPATFTLTVNPLPVITLATNMANDLVCVDNDVVFTTESGMTGYIWDLGGATITSGGTASSNTATLKWNTAGSKTVSVSYTNANGCTSTATAKTIIVRECYAPTITTTTLPNGTVGVPYSQTLEATGDMPITWSLDNGASLPSGLTLSPDGVISGTPTTAETATFTVKAENSAGDDTKSLSITVNPVIVVPNPDPAPDPTIYVTGVSLNLASLEGKVGDDGVELVATVTPRFATDRNVRWSTSDPLVATVTHYGLVNFVGPGTATITVITLDGDYIAECVVTVSSATGIEDVSPSATLYAVPSSDGLQVCGLVPDEVFSIYNMAGQLLFSGKATAAEQLVLLRERGVYIVTTGNRSVRAVY